MGLDLVEIIMAIEDHFDVRISDEHMATIQTVGQMHDYVVQLRVDQGATDGHALWTQVWCDLAGIVAEQMGIDVASISPASFWADITPDG